MKSAVYRDVAAGGLAGMIVDVTLFPIDTLKTRLQAKGGFWAAGGMGCTFLSKNNR